MGMEDCGTVLDLDLDLGIECGARGDSRFVSREMEERLTTCKSFVLGCAKAACSGGDKGWKRCASSES